MKVCKCIETLSKNPKKISLISIHLNEASFSDQTFISAFHSLLLLLTLIYSTVSSQPDYYTHHLFIYVIIYFIHINNINTIYIHLYV